MTTRIETAQKASVLVGTVHATGYDQPNPFSTDLGRPVEAWCGDFVTDVFKKTGIPLPSMQPGCRTGFAYCPDAWDWAGAHAARKHSWEALPGDIALFDWNGNGVADHTEMVIGWNNGTLVTVGGNSGPDGGVNRHEWNAPTGSGNPQILGVVDSGKAVRFGSPPVMHPAAPPTHWAGHRVLMLKSPHMRGADVAAMQAALIAKGLSVGTSGRDGDFGPFTREGLMAFQQRVGLVPDGIRGPLTFAKLGA